MWKLYLRMAVFFLRRLHAEVWMTHKKDGYVLHASIPTQEHPWGVSCKEAIDEAA